MLIGRQNEIAIFEEIYQSKTSEFLAIYGRRRVGKTYLVKHVFAKKECVFFKISGQHDGTLNEQLINFTRAVEKAFYKPGTTILKEPSSWMKAFEILTNVIKEYTQNKKVVLFFDELPWLATKRSKFLQALDYYWNNEWVDQSKIKLNCLSTLLQ